jgi:DNA-binding transcriptional MerR regulator
MQAGKLAAMLGVHSDTIRTWTDMYSDFFSTDARGENRARREYGWEDQVIANTIAGFRNRDKFTFEEIRARLAGGERDENLPRMGNEPLEGETALAIYAKVKSLEDTVELLKTTNQEQQERYEKRIDELTREASEWRTRYQILKEQKDDK